MNYNAKPFKLIRLLGTGTFSQTWLARVKDEGLLDEWGEEDVAVKIPLDKRKERALKKDLELESALKLQLDDRESKYIARYLGFTVYEGKPVMAMKYISGGSLRDLMGGPRRRRKLHVKQALEIVKGILCGLSVIHSKRVVHRDIKPENILMDRDIPRISDFGIARMLKKNEQASAGAGTLNYMSPEMLSDMGRGSFNTDIWSLGVIFYEMLCGGYPFGIENRTPRGRVKGIIRDDDIGLAFPKGIKFPGWLKTVMARALERNPKKRYKSAGAMLRDIRQYEKNIGLRV